MPEYHALSDKNIKDTYFQLIPRDILNLLKSYIYNQLIFIGDNQHGQFGNGNTTSILIPDIKTFNDNYVNDLFCGPDYSIINIDTKLYISGRVSSLGLRAPLSISNLLLQKCTRGFMALKAFNRLKLVPKKVACGDEFIAILTTNGNLYTLGINHHGLLGIGHKRKRGINLIDNDVSDISTGHSHTIYLKDQKIYAFGANKYGALGYKHSTVIYSPEWIPGFYDVSEIFCGYNITAFFDNWILSDTNYPHLYVCGDNTDFVLANGFEDTIFGPVNLEIDTYSKIHDKNHLRKDSNNVPSKLSFGYHHACAIIHNQLFVRGSNKNGQLGLGTTQYLPLLCHIDFFDGQIVEDVICGFNTTIVKADGIYYGTGNNEYGQLGLGDKMDRNTWTPLLELSRRNPRKLILTKNYLGMLI
jgi:alpha-tubulin suppressor-like RCC1 family protein